MEDKEYWQLRWENQHCENATDEFCETYMDCINCPYGTMWMR